MYIDKKTNLYVIEEKHLNFKALVERAVRYHMKLGNVPPTICYAHPDDVDPTIGDLTGLIDVLTTYTMPRGHLWLGIVNDKGGLSITRQPPQIDVDVQAEQEI